MILFFLYVTGVLLEYSEVAKRRTLILLTDSIIISIITLLVLLNPFLFQQFFHIPLIFIFAIGILFLFYPLFEIVKHREEKKRKLFVNSLVNGNFFFFAILFVVYSIFSFYQATYSLFFVSVSLILIINSLMYFYYRIAKLKVLFYLIIFVTVLFGILIPFQLSYITYGFIGQGSGAYSDALNKVFASILGDPIMALVAILIIFGALIKLRPDRASKYLGTAMMLFVPIIFWLMILLGIVPVPPDLIRFVLFNNPLIAYIVYVLLTLIFFVILITISSLITNIVAEE